MPDRGGGRMRAVKRGTRLLGAAALFLAAGAGAGRTSAVLPEAPDLAGVAAGASAAHTPAVLPAAPDLAGVAVDLGGAWRWRAGEGASDWGAAVGLADAEWATFTPPGHLALPKTAKTLWLRRRFTVPPAGAGLLALRLGAFAGTAAVFLDGADLGGAAPPSAPVFLPALPALAPGDHVLAVRVALPKGKEGLWWNGAAPALGPPGPRRRGYFEMAWGFRRADPAADPHPPYGLYLPEGWTPDAARPAPLVVALHGWGGSIRSFVPYGLTREADRTGAVVVFPEGGKTLYIEAHEDAILRAIDEVAAALPIDPDRITLLGVSMGGAGAVGVGFHYPDRFAALVSYFGDSLYDMKTYVKGTLKTDEMAARYSVLHVPENARHLPVFLVHGKADKVCPFEQSQWLYDALHALGLPVRFEAPAADGHTVSLVARFLPTAFDFLMAARRVKRPARVSYGKNHDAYAGAYWVRFTLAREGEFGHVDVEADAADHALVLRDARGVKALTLRLGDAPADAAGARRLRVTLEAPLAVRLEGLPAAADGFRRAKGSAAGCAKGRAARTAEGAVELALPAGTCAYEWGSAASAAAAAPGP
ncbi:MAG TPA: prolyl oligopeptidase family serine peptidase [Myxococcota bacterium]|nr:prolyl oligopeptidase family serine peptidase [Myxococcota bacterium]